MNIVCVGDCGVDKYSDGIVRPGGITLNFAVHAQKLFPPTDLVTIITAVGTDNQAKIIQALIQKKNIHAVLTRLSGKTPQQDIQIEKDGERKFTKYQEGVLAKFIPDQEQNSLIQSADFVMIPLFKQIHHLFDAVIKMKRSGITAVDFTDLSDYSKDVEIVKIYMNHFDIGFFGLKKSDIKLISALQALAKEFNKLFVITLGEEGSMLYSSKKFFAPAFHVRQVVDTTGAGDAFAAAFIHSYLYSQNIEKSLLEGNKYASNVVQQKGAFTL